MNTESAPASHDTAPHARARGLRRPGRFPMLVLFLYLGAMLAWISAKPIFAGDVVINGEPLTANEVAMLSNMAGAPVPPGDYWYDPVCGAWGYRGGPCMGFGRAGVAVGGELAGNASGGGTGVFVNGRELHPYDVAALKNCTGVVYQGRYWLNANGIGGFEGGPPLFNLAQMCGGKTSGKPGKSKLLNYGSVMAGDGFIGFIDSEGRSFSSGP